jgi:hypothetical protein
METEAVVTRFIMAVAICIVGGCATPYQERGYAGGFEQRMIREDVYVVSFHGNGFTSPRQVKDFSMLRAAEIGQKLGFTHFVVLGTEDQSKREIISTGTTSNTTGSVYGNGNYATYTGTTTTHANTMPVFKPGVEMGVQFFEGRPQGRFLEVFEIQEVSARIRRQYHLDEN